MIRKLFIIMFIMALAIGQGLAVNQIAGERRPLPSSPHEMTVIKGPFVKIAALEFDGIAADYLFLTALVFIGSTAERVQTPRVSESEWRWFISLLDAATDVDPYLLAPYYVGSAYLAWNAGNVKEANRLLSKGMNYRTWDWFLPFTLGFNHFYFLHDNAKANEYLMEASRKPGASPLFGSLAASLAFRDRETLVAIVFLEEMLGRTDDKALQRQFEMRIEFLRGVLALEKAVSIYKSVFHKMPSKIDELLERNIITGVPKEPYGGRYYLNRDGSVNSTSNLPQLHRRKQNAHK